MKKKLHSDIQSPNRKGQFLQIIVMVILLMGMNQMFAINTATLIKQSPFVPEGYVAPEEKTTEPPPPPQDLEFKGLYQLSGIYYLNIFNAREQRGNWVQVNQKFGDVFVKSYDPEARMVVLEVAGKDMELELKKFSDTPIPVASANTSGPTNSNTLTSGRRSITSGQRSNKSVTPRRRVVVPNRKTSTNTGTPPPRAQNTAPKSRQSVEDLVERLRKQGKANR